MDYLEFLKSKSHSEMNKGFDPLFLPDWMFPFQKMLTEWSIRKGRGANFADCGLGKTPMQLVFAENVVRKTNKNVLILTPLCVSNQTAKEGEKFGISVKKSKDGTPKGKITVTNYEKLHHFDPSDFVGVVCDESSILKNYDGKRRRIITEFMKKIEYRQLYTATAAPNDFIELGTSAEALGEMGHMDMLSQFFINDENSNHPIFWGARWRFKKHGEKMFWKWVCSWARAIRKPSDYGFSDEGYKLPELITNEHIIENDKAFRGQLFPVEAKTLNEQREELRLTLKQRCELSSELAQKNKSSVMWCGLNDEGDLLEKLTPGSKQVKGGQSDEEKEEILQAFTDGELKYLITKPKIAGFGLNWQHINHMTFFPSHSFEQYYQSIRRMYRFGQQNPVTVDVITSNGNRGVYRNLQRKINQSDEMFKMLVKYMTQAIKIDNSTIFNKEIKLPKWI